MLPSESREALSLFLIKQLLGVDFVKFLLTPLPSINFHVPFAKVLIIRVFSIYFYKGFVKARNLW